MSLDDFEKDIENNFEKQLPMKNMSREISLLTSTAALHSKSKKSITIRVHEMDLEAIRIKASRVGVPYQTYINMLIHNDATHI